MDQMSTARTKSKPARKPAASESALKKVVSLAGFVSGQVGNPKSHSVRFELSPGKLIKAIRAGLPVRELERLQTSLDMPMDKLARKLGISKATLHRRKARGRLGPAESDRVMRFARLMGKAVEVMESEAAARQWLNSPQVGLGGAAPLDYAETEVGAREVEDLLGRIEYGVYS